VIPFDAVRTFVDPSVEFGLRFETRDEDDDDEDDGDDAESSAQDAPDTGGKAHAKTHKAEVVSLDKFRK